MLFNAGRGRSVDVDSNESTSRGLTMATAFVKQRQQKKELDIATMLSNS